MSKTVNEKPVSILPLITSRKVIVNYDETMEELIKASKRDLVDDDITPAHFPSSEKGQSEVTIDLVEFYSVGTYSSDDVLKKLDDMGFRSATLKEILAFGAQFPDLRGIVSLGSSWRDSYGDLNLTYLDVDEGRRRLVLRGWDYGWGSGWQFAAVRK